MTETGTCIIALRHSGHLYMAGDSAGVNGWLQQYHVTTEKVFKKGEYLFGFTSSWRMGQLLQHKLDIPDKREKTKPRVHMATEFIEAVRSCLKKGGYMKISDNVESGGTFLVGYRKMIFVVESNFQVLQIDEPYLAVGCGAQIALGSLYTSRRKKDPRKILRIALEAAERFSAGVRRPFMLVSTEREEIEVL